MTFLQLRGVTQNNLKGIDLDLPLGKAIVVTGPSGSGKSSLAFETIFAEGQRRYMQSLSTYARQFLQKFSPPKADKIQNIPPTIALEQINPVKNSRATVGTTTEIYDYLRLFFEKLGVEYCEDCHIPMERLSLTEIADKLGASLKGKDVLIAFSKEFEKGAISVELLEEWQRAGFARLLLRNKVIPIDDLILAKKPPKGKNVTVLVDRIRMSEQAPDPSMVRRIGESVKLAMDAGNKEAQVFLWQDDKATELESVTTEVRCPKCKKKGVPKTAISFSFNSPIGACERCKGFGNTLELDENLVVPNPRLTIADGAIDPLIKPSLRHWHRKLLEFCKQKRIDSALSYQQLSEAEKKLLFDGDKTFRGVRGVFKMLEEEKYKMRVRVFLSRYLSPFTCPDCHGARLKSSALRVKVNGLSIADVVRFSVENFLVFLRELELDKAQEKISEDICAQLVRRLQLLDQVGLSYLTLDRLSKTLSGGEYQRILLATQLSQGLTDTLYVLDEPSIGLHPRDTDRLLAVLDALKKRGNSLIVVEHDPDVIRWGEYVIDMGPGSGVRGGEVLFCGTQEQFKDAETPTANAIREWDYPTIPLITKYLSPNHSSWIEIKGAQGNNLKNIDVRIPTRAFVTITGVSGSGKSTLVVDTLYQALAKLFGAPAEKIEKFKSLKGFENLGGVELVDQSSIGRSTRSNPITFIKGYDEVRAIFAATPEAQRKGFPPGFFSFNVVGGRCETCEGEGRIKVDMVFLEDVWVPCEACDQKRFKPAVLAVKHKGKNIDDCLNMTVEESYDFFDKAPSLRMKLSLLKEVGLGYLRVGQPGYTLSGGEAQRLKIARELGNQSAARKSTLFILDEPTTGLHFREVDRLINVFRQLVAAGHSVLVIEHNLQLIAASQYLIDMGPEGGDKGGLVIGVGTPKELANNPLSHTGFHLAKIFREKKV